jgi:hypothetical protein
MHAFTHRQEQHNPLFLLIHGLLFWFLLLFYEQGAAQS